MRSPRRRPPACRSLADSPRAPLPCAKDCFMPEHEPVPVDVTISEPEPESLAERRRSWLERSQLYLVCEARLGGREPEEVLRPALQAGVDVVQLREKSGV